MTRTKQVTTTIIGLSFLTAACATPFEPSTVRNLSCTQIQTGLNDLGRERKGVVVGSLLGGIAIAIAAGPWVAVPMILLPGLRGNRGEFALAVVEVVKGCEDG